MKLAISEPRQLDKRYFFQRIIAYFIDVTLLTVVVQGSQWGLFTLTDGFPFTRMAEINSGWLIYGWVFLTVSLPIWLYFIWGERSARQATLGKRLMGLKVVADSDEKPSWQQVFSRTVLKLIPWELFHLAFMLPVPLLNDPTAAFRPGFLMGFVVLILYLLVLVQTPRRQSIHDVIARTYVVAKR
ncbi:MAG: RDD family protein [Chloroflexota bacterium]